MCADMTGTYMTYKTPKSLLELSTDQVGFNSL
jgi:hypothetical protein